MGMSSDGLPIGAHLIAPLGQERLLLELSLQIEQAKAFKKILD
jgi:amidase